MKTTLSPSRRKTALKVGLYMITTFVRQSLHFFTRSPVNHFSRWNAWQHDETKTSKCQTDNTKPVPVKSLCSLYSNRMSLEKTALLFPPTLVSSLNILSFSIVTVMSAFDIRYLSHSLEGDISISERMSFFEQFSIVKRDLLLSWKRRVRKRDGLSSW